MITSFFRVVRGVAAASLIFAAFLWFAYNYSPAAPTIKDVVARGVDVVSGAAEKADLHAIPAPSISLPAPPTPTSPPSPVGGPSISVAPPPGSFAKSASGVLGADLIRNLDVEDPHEDGTYSRDKQFGPAWKDVDRNGCDTRNDILKRDLASSAFKAGSTCIVASGVLADPYSGTTIRWERKQVTVKSVGDYVDVDHIVPLKVVYYAGGRDWDQSKREAIANDPDNLAVVDSYTNQHYKGDKSIGEWAPSATPGRCQYATQYAKVIAKYGLTVSRDDATALQQFATSCR